MLLVSGDIHDLANLSSIDTPDIHVWPFKPELLWYTWSLHFIFCHCSCTRRLPWWDTNKVWQWRTLPEAVHRLHEGPDHTPELLPHQVLFPHTRTRPTALLLRVCGCRQPLRLTMNCYTLYNSCFLYEIRNHYIDSNSERGDRIRH